MIYLVLKRIFHLSSNYSAVAAVEATTTPIRMEAIVQQAN